MGRILYGVMGDSGGHISRSLAIALQMRTHEIVFVGGERVATEMARHGYTTVPVPVLATELRGSRVAVGPTVARAIAGMAMRSAVLARLDGAIRELDPDLIISDYEYFLPLAARRCGRPCISVDRQHALTHCGYRRPPGHAVSRALTVSIIRSMYSAASRYLVCSFVRMEPRDPLVAETFPAVLGAAVQERRPTEGEHAVVYVRGMGLDWLRSLLGGRRRRYVVYGFDLDREEGNLQFKRASAEEFLDDLAACAFLISNGGHNALSEALHFGKPVLSVPTRLFYEQLVNAYLSSEAGYGAYCEPDARAGAALDAFEKDLPRFQAAATGYAPWKRETVVGRLEELVAHGHGC